MGGAAAVAVAAAAFGDLCRACCFHEAGKVMGGGVGEGAPRPKRRLER